MGKPTNNPNKIFQCRRCGAVSHIKEVIDDCPICYLKKVMDGLGFDTHIVVGGKHKKKG